MLGVIKWHESIFRFFSFIIIWAGIFDDFFSCENTSFFVFTFQNFRHSNVVPPPPPFFSQVFCFLTVSLLWKSFLTLSNSFLFGNLINICRNFFGALVITTDSCFIGAMFPKALQYKAKSISFGEGGPRYTFWIGHLSCTLEMFNYFNLGFYI